MIRRPPRSTQSRSSAASDVYKRQSHRYGGLTDGERVDAPQPQWEFPRELGNERSPIVSCTGTVNSNWGASQWQSNSSPEQWGIREDWITSEWSQQNSSSAATGWITSTRGWTDSASWTRSSTPQVVNPQTADIRYRYSSRENELGGSWSSSSSSTWWQSSNAHQRSVRRT